MARYSFIGTDISQAFIVRGSVLEERSLRRATSLGGSSPAVMTRWHACRPLLAAQRPEPVPGLPRFSGGLVGYLGYDAVRFFEPTVPLEGHPELPDAVFLLADTVIAFDHAFGRLVLIANARLDDPEGIPQANRRLDALAARIHSPIPVLADLSDAYPPTELLSTMTRQAYMDAVIQAKEHIAAGDIFQVVVSQRLSAETTAAPFDIYRALRRLNPSPYMFFFDFAGLAGPAAIAPDRSLARSARPLGGAAALLRPIAGHTAA